MPATADTAPARRLPGTSAEAVLRRLEWTVMRRLDGVLQGDYRTLFRGLGLDLADLREYQHHDDVRHIDWNVTARLQQPHVRQYTEDRELTAWFLLDLSGSMEFGSQVSRAGAEDTRQQEQRKGQPKGQGKGPPQRDGSAASWRHDDGSKRGMSAEFLGVLARLLTRHGNRVGALLYGQRIDAVLPAGQGRQHVLHLLQRVLQHRPSAPASPSLGETQLQQLLRGALPIIKRRSTVFVLSDFISAPGWEAALAQLAQRHDVLAVRLYDPLEMALPDLGLITLQDAETGEQVLVDTHDSRFRARYARMAEQRDADTRAALMRAGVDTLELSTEEDLVSTLLRFIDLRRQRTRLAAGGCLPAHLRPGAAALSPHTPTPTHGATR